MDTEHDDDTASAEISNGAQRSREHRRREKLGLRIAKAELSGEHIDALVRAGYLAEGDREDPDALAAASGCG
jgi:hypothetical protein